MCVNEQAAQLGYDQHEFVWNHSAMQLHKQLAEEQASQPSYINAAAKPGQRSSGSSKSSAGAGASEAAEGSGGSGGGVDVFDAAQAAALIRAAKEEAKQRKTASTRSAAAADDAAALVEEREALRKELAAADASPSAAAPAGADAVDADAGGRRSSINPIHAQAGRASEVENPLMRASAAKKAAATAATAAALAAASVEDGVVPDVDADGGTEVYFYRSDSLHSSNGFTAVDEGNAHGATAANTNVNRKGKPAGESSSSSNTTAQSTDEAPAGGRSSAGAAAGRVSFARDVKGGAGSPLEVAAPGSNGGDGEKRRLLQDKKPSKCCCSVS